jgi:hypothetical protein
MPTDGICKFSSHSNSRSKGTKHAIKERGLFQNFCPKFIYGFIRTSIVQNIIIYISGGLED